MKEWYNKNKTLVLAGGTFLALLLIGLIVWITVASTALSIRNEGERREQDLVTVYNNSLISLSTCLDSGRVAAQVTEREFESIKEILTNVSAARYVTSADGTQTDAGEALGGGQLFSAIVEAYPTIDQRSWQILQTEVVGCREKFQNSQVVVQYQAGKYKKWIVSDDLFYGAVRDEFPSDELVMTTAAGETFTGDEALKHIIKPVALPAASLGFETGVLPEQDLFGEN